MKKWSKQQNNKLKINSHTDNESAKKISVKKRIIKIKKDVIAFIIVCILHCIYLEINIFKHIFFFVFFQTHFKLDLHWKFRIKTEISRFKNKCMVYIILYECKRIFKFYFFNKQKNL